MEHLKLQELRTGAAQPQLTLNGINHLSILLPSFVLFNEFNIKIDSIFEMSDILRKQNQKLTEARDLLLPRLMSGEIAV